jgi:hypothetical protein
LSVRTEVSISFLPSSFRPRRNKTCPQVMNVTSVGSEFLRRINRAQSPRIFLLPLINLGQPNVRIRQSRIAPQGFAIILLRIAILLHKRVDVSQFVVVKGEIGLDGRILQKLIAGLLVILLSSDKSVRG